MPNRERERMRQKRRPRERNKSCNGRAMEEEGARVIIYTHVVINMVKGYQLGRGEDEGGWKAVSLPYPQFC